MPKTNADYQREHRQRQARRLAALEARCVALEAERNQISDDLEAALAECDRLAATQCKHPAGAIDCGTCRAFGIDLW